MVALIRKGGLVGRPSLYKIAQAVRGTTARAVHAMRRVPGRPFSLELLMSTSPLNARILIGESLQPLTILESVRTL
jgi:hypothetical protein